MLKVKYDKEVHYLKLNEQSISLDGLKERLRGKFKVCPPSFYLTYKDDEGDDIIISRQDDLITAFQLAKPKRIDKIDSILKLVIVQDEQAIDLCNREQSLSVQMDSNGLNEAESFQLLRSSDHSDFQELNEQIKVQEPVLQRFDMIQNEEISKIVRGNLYKLQTKIIQNALDQAQNTLLSNEVDSYLLEMYQQIEKNLKFQIEKEIKQQHTPIQQSKLQKTKISEMSSMIAKSLQKLLPAFMKEVAEKTIQRVKQQLIKEQICFLYAKGCSSRNYQ